MLSGVAILTVLQPQTYQMRSSQQCLPAAACAKAVTASGASAKPAHLKFQSTLYLPTEATIHFSWRLASVTQVKRPFWKGAPCTQQIWLSSEPVSCLAIVHADSLGGGDIMRTQQLCTAYHQVKLIRTRFGSSSAPPVSSCAAEELNQALGCTPVRARSPPA